MRNLKRVVTLFAIVLALWGIAACGGPQTPPPAGPPTGPTEEVKEAPKRQITKAEAQDFASATKRYNSYAAAAKKGARIHPHSAIEGARWNNVFATYLHGPVLPKNPWLTDSLLRIAVGRAESIPSMSVRLSVLEDSFEKRAHDVALAKAMASAASAMAAWKGIRNSASLAAPLAAAKVFSASFRAA